MDYDWITPRVAVGGALESRHDADELVAQGVSHVVNMCLGHADDPCFAHLREVRLASFGLADGDNEGDLGYQRLCSAIAYVVAVLAGDPRARIYLHCAAGISRSASVMVGVLMETESLTLARAVERVRQVRPVINPHPAHLVALLRRQADQKETPASTNGPS